MYLIVLITFHSKQLSNINSISLTYVFCINLKSFFKLNFTCSHVLFTNLLIEKFVTIRVAVSSSNNILRIPLIVTGKLYIIKLNKILSVTILYNFS